ncbi:hypothetical protein [Curtobacterium aetherium]|uniref:Uncharacterized protein n=1 Tax=Curtobacterium aetherium TaxID=2841594 RepID=A0ACD1E5D1_9MICO|nr:hypothetical protein [Curtobacterium sp. L6-1]QWS34046.1 hypothetical protein KM842_02250 [Curtobacterium sp. L6-1]
MIITTGSGQEITIDRPHGREINPDVWAMPDGELRRVQRLALGWRMDVVYYDDSGIRAIGQYRPEHIDGSPFPTGWNSCTPRAECYTGPSGHMRVTRYVAEPHPSPLPQCGCGLRLMEHIGQVSELVRERGDQFLSEWSLPSEPVQHALCISSVVGLGLTCNGEELDPEGTIRTQWLALDDHLLFGQQDAHVAEMFRQTSMDVHVVPDLGALRDV